MLRAEVTVFSHCSVLSGEMAETSRVPSVATLSTPKGLVKHSSSSNGEWGGYLLTVVHFLMYSLRLSNFKPGPRVARTRHQLSPPHAKRGFAALARYSECLSC